MMPTHQYKDSAAGEEPHHRGKTSPTPIDQIAQIKTSRGRPMHVTLSYQGEDEYRDASQKTTAFVMSLLRSDERVRKSEEKASFTTNMAFSSLKCPKRKSKTTSQ